MGSVGRFASAVMVGLGVGAMLGAAAGSGIVWPALAVGLLGVGLSVIGLRKQPSGSAPGNQPVPRPPAAAAVGSHVQQVLDLAERQAESIRQAAGQEAAQLLAQARSEAQAVAGRTGPAASDQDPLRRVDLSDLRTQTPD